MVLNRTVLAGLVLAVTVTACGRDIQSGYVTQHDYKPAHSYEESDPLYTPVCSGSGSTFSCQSVLTGWTSHTVAVPDRYYLRVRDDVADKKGRHQEGWVQVDQRSFHDFTDGMHWPDPR